LAEDIIDEDVLDKSVEDTSKKSSKMRMLFKKIFGSKKAIIITALSLALLISLVLGLLLLFFKGSPEETQDVQDVRNIIVEQQEAIVFEEIIDLEPFERIRLKAGSTMVLISMDLSLELMDHRYRKQVYTMEERIREIVKGQMEEMTWLELRSPEGKIMLKYNLLKRINSIFPKYRIRDIYFTNFIMQRSNYE